MAPRAGGDTKDWVGTDVPVATCSELLGTKFPLGDGGWWQWVTGDKWGVSRDKWGAWGISGDGDIGDKWRQVGTGTVALTGGSQWLSPGGSQWCLCATLARGSQIGAGTWGTTCPSPPPPLTVSSLPVTHHPKPPQPQITQSSKGWGDQIHRGGGKDPAMGAQMGGWADIPRDEVPLGVPNAPGGTTAPQ